MSYEGRVQVITKKGHLHAFDDSGGNTYTSKPEDVWINCIDDTNCEAYREIPYVVLKKFYAYKEPVYQVCNLGHNHCISEEVFRIPGKESKYLRHAQVYKGDSYIMKPLYPKEYNDLCTQLSVGEVFGTEPEK